MSVSSLSAGGADNCVPHGLDKIYVTASRRDARFTRICVASIRYFYPDAPIVLLKGGTLEPGLEAELRRFWDVVPAGIEDRADWGYGFVKLEPLFAPAGERFVMLDSDLVLAGPILDHWTQASPQFVVDDDSDGAQVATTYYDWREVHAIDPAALPTAFVFNTGQWFGTSGVLTRDDFDPWLDWSGPVPAIRHDALFRSGEQGLLNYVVNQKVAAGAISIEHRQIMHWPGIDLGGMTLNQISARTAPPLVIHWAGLKRRRIENMTGGEVLAFFEELYYARLPWARARRLRSSLDHNFLGLEKSLRHQSQRLFARR